MFWISGRVWFYRVIPLRVFGYPTSSLLKAKNILTDDQIDKITADVEENEDLETNTDRDKHMQNAVSRHIFHGFANLHKIPVEKRKYFKDSVNEEDSEDKM